MLRSIAIFVLVKGSRMIQASKSDWIARPEQASRPAKSLRAIASIPGSLPPASLLVFGMITVQLGAALAKNLFGALGPAGVVFLRISFAALALLVLWRPWRALGRRDATTDMSGVTSAAGSRRSAYLAVVLFGLVLALMNFTFYSAIARIPLGIAV